LRILVAEDDAILADGLMRSLRKAGHAVDWVKNGVEAESAVATGAFDLLILDLGLPKMNGLDALKCLRARGSQVPVLILTALDGVQERVRALDLGADDYLAKPFALEELEARVRALTRRSHGGTSAVLTHAQLSYDQAGKVAQINGVTVDLSAREMALLEMLLQRAGRVVNKAQLVDHLCEWGEEVSANAIEVYVHRLRRKLETGGVKIVTVRGLGYCIEKAASSASAQSISR
jgi:two-component system, OmpR family, response regulator